MIIVSGIQPSGQPHLGNYLGAIKQQIQIQGQGQAYYFIADYHAMTSLHDGEKLRNYSFDIAAAYLALGLDPSRVALFRQSDIPEVTELFWILCNATPFGLMNRAHAFKDKIEKGLSANIGLFTYPILMAADILIYGGELVPVGQDQIQHVEIAKDIAASFNHLYKAQVFVEPKYRLSETPKVLGTDGQKMGKSFGNIIPIFWEKQKDLKKIISSIVTDSKDYTKEPLDPTTDNVFKIYSLLANPEEIEAMKHQYLNNRSFGYGHAKQVLCQKIESVFTEANDKFHSYQSNPDFVYNTLREGAKIARLKARETLDRVRKITGLN